MRCCRLPPRARAWRSRTPRCWRNVSAGAGENVAAIPPALQRYAGLRRARVARVQRTARRNGKIYHLGGAAALARDLFIRAIGPQRMLARQDWILRLAGVSANGTRLKLRINRRRCPIGLSHGRCRGRSAAGAGAGVAVAGEPATHLFRCHVSSASLDDARAEM